MKRVKILPSKNGERIAMARRVDRLMELLEIMHDQGVVELSEICDRFGVGERAAYRYIRDLRDIGSMVEFDPVRKGYRIREINRNQETMTTGNKLLASLLVQLLEKIRPPGRESLLENLRRTASELKSEKRVVVNLLSPPQSPEIEVILETIHQAILANESIDLVYSPPPHDTETKRRFDPYLLVYTQGNWWVVGYCNLRKQIRTLAVDRIREVKSTGKKFIPDPNFDPEKFEGRSFQMFDDGHRIEVVIRFDAEVAPIIKARQWHPSQKCRDLKNGGVELSFSTTGLPAVKRWLYHWLPNFEVVEPAELREEMAAEMKEGLGKINKFRN